MDTLKTKHATLSESVFAQVESTSFQSRVAAKSTALSALQEAQPTAAEASPAAQALRPVTNLNEALMRARSIVAAKIPFELRAQSIDEILKVLHQSNAQASSEIYAHCLIEVARGVVRREVPMSRSPHVTQFLIMSLDPRAIPLHQVSSRKVVRLFSCMLGLGLIPSEAVNAVAAVMLFQMNTDHWSNKERVSCLEGFLWAVFGQDHSSLFRSSTLARVLRVANDRKNPLSVDDMLGLATPLSSCIGIGRIPSASVLEVLNFLMATLRTGRGPVTERAVIALNIATHMNEDFSLKAPIQELHSIAELPGVTSILNQAIKAQIRKQSESYYRSLSR